MSALADQIRAHLAQDGNFAKGTAANTALLALLAAVDECERLDCPAGNATARRAVLNSVLAVIAR